MGNGQKAVNDLASQLREETSTRIQDRVTQYFKVPELANQVNLDDLHRGQWSLQDLKSQERQAWHLLDLFHPTAQVISIATHQGTHGGIKHPVLLGVADNPQSLNYQQWLD